ncbi:MAG: hypothetical protein KF688_08340 [Pirellulales bacterium]|nr:hypothetical protein [Pirellulales bacterium]MBX3434730.1 hypothetical protein [Pirellulales bacterium]
METSLHRQLKALYVADATLHEVVLGDYRIDAVRGKELIEVQHGSLAAIRDKIRRLLDSHRVRVVKPIVARKTLVKLPAPGAEPTSRRKSPKRGTLLDLFDELVYFTRVFPHPRLTLEVVLVEVEELRYPGRGKRRRRRRPEAEFQIEDQRLVAVDSHHQFRKASDLMRLLPPRLPRPFHTGHLAEGLGVPRWIAQRIAYCLRETGAVEEAGKAGNAILYRRKGRAA